MGGTKYCFHLLSALKIFILIVYSLFNSNSIRNKHKNPAKGQQRTQPHMLREKLLSLSSILEKDVITYRQTALNGLLDV